MNNLHKKLNVLAEWFNRQGYQTIFSKSSGWVEFARGVYQAFPYHWVIDLHDNEIDDLFKTNRIIALRYSTSLVSSAGHISYHVIFDKNCYELSSLHKKARHDVTRGLEHASYEPITLERLACEGWELQYETLVRQGRQQAGTKECWEKMCLCAEDLPGFEAWGAIYKGELVATLLSYTLDGTVSILCQQSKTTYLEFCVNNALTYQFTREVLQRPEIHCIFYGLHSLDAPAGVDEFKIRMGYSARPVRQRVVFNPFVRPFVNPLSCSLVRKLHAVWPDNTKLSKAVGMVNFYLQGRHRLSEQEWPKVILEQKDIILTHSK